MKITLDVDDQLLSLLREEAARSGRTLSELVEVGVRLLLSGMPSTAKPLPSLPTFNSGGHLVDISNRDELYDALDRQGNGRGW
ncbi:MAG: ribbon-helix-helix protein, CopG family [Planctomycetes bacterium]|nr:ribbon-helix-helix protein, CopG family [Planctomycetota bacterium]